MNDIKHDLQEQRRVRRLRDRNIKWGRELGKLPELQRACAAASVPCAVLKNDGLPYKANKRSLSEHQHRHGSGTEKSFWLANQDFDPLASLLTSHM